MNYIEYTVTVWASGDKFWYLNDKRHREDGPACEYANGTKAWYLNGRCHRQGGPAIEYSNGNKTWYLNGKLHREDGPAIEGVDVPKAWFLNDKCYSEVQFNAEMVKRRQPASCAGKVVEIDGKKYRLTEV